MRLMTLLSDFMSVPAKWDVAINQLQLNSAKVTPGSLFIALKGSQADGRQYIHDALTRGAVAVLVEASHADESIYCEGSIPIIPLELLQMRLGGIAAKFYGDPSNKLRMIGVTGTNGKTSCTHFIAEALEDTCGLIGTLGAGYYGRLVENAFTTPDCIALQTILNQFVAEGAKAVAMEVSSHGIDQGRVNGVNFEIGVFTNLTQDHLDYHGTMGAYAKVKHRFLTNPATKRLVINIDDEYGLNWLDSLKHDKPVFAYSTRAPARAYDYPLTYASRVKHTLHGMEVMLHTPWGEGEVVLSLIGEFNLSNALAVLTTLCVYGMPFATALGRLAKLHPVPGRMQMLGGKGKPLIVVDYSHTPDALEKALLALRSHTEGRLICVFGCGGDRDHGKRPLMAKIAERLSDQVIVTSDNPRSESPSDIADQIMQGFLEPERVLVELDRSKAIENSIQLAKYNDCILIAGKGAERYQLVGNEKLPFDDVEKAKAYLEQY